MPADDSYIQDSLETNLFYMRIMKEHALFLQLALTPKNGDLADMAENIRMRMDELMRQTIQASRGYISDEVLSSGELYTRFTEEAERQTQFFTGVPVDMQLTVEEYNIGGAGDPPPSMQVFADRLNANAMSIAGELLHLKERIYADVASCRMITMIYPSQIGHLIHEARDYVDMLNRLMRHELVMGPAELADEEAFWNRIMQDHAEFIDGLLDPSERELKRTARGFILNFERLTRQADAAKRALQTLPVLTRRTIPAMQEISGFKAQSTGGILSCKIKSTITPLLADHVLREANYYLRVLKETMS